MVKIFIFNKKILLLFLIIITILIIIFSSIIYSPKTELVHTDAISSELFINNVKKLMNGERKIAYLTFDDGPNVLITPKV